MAALSLGPYQLDRPIRQGGTGHVWAGTHRDTGLAVALKVLDAPGSSAAARQALRSEVRAMVALEHPRIVRVLDQLLVDAPLAEGAGFALGAPVLVMDLAEGDLTKRASTLDWAGTAQALLDVLDALAHAHARGVIHRDLKPANVLFDAAGRYALTDFGLAWVETTVEKETPPQGGTPAYMAPEQVAQRWRDTGPWTDLYSLGVMGWALATGGVPHDVRTPAQARRAHSEGLLVAFQPRFPVPSTLEAWLRRLLAPDPSQRYRRAADAAWSLTRLLEPRRWVQPDPDRPATPPEVPRLDDTLTTLRWDQPRNDLPPPTEAAGMATVETPPLPAVAPAPLPGRALPAGLGETIATLRPVAFVGRRAERDRLWSALGEVHLKRGARLVLLEGPGGFGCSRLATWLTETAHGVGAATVLRATHAATSGPSAGLGPMVARDLRCFGLRGGTLIARLQGLLRRQGATDPREWSGMAELIAPREGPARFHSAREWHVLVLRLIERRSRERPVVLVLDDVQWGTDALGLVRELFSGRWRRLPVLVVLTARTEDLAARLAEARLIDRTVKQADGVRIAIGPLPSGDVRQLVSVLVDGDPQAAASIAERADGNPLLAVQLARSRLTQGVTPPDEDLDAVWRRRVEHALQGRPTADRHALELAAVLGLEVDAAEWAELVARAAVTPTDDLVEVLLDAELVHAAPEGAGVAWSFAHGGLHETLARGAAEAGRWTDWNAHAADLLADRGAGVAGRRGQHLVEARRADEAVDALLVGAEHLLERGDLRAELMLERAEQALGSLSPTDPRRGDVAVLRAVIARFLLQAEQMDAFADEVEAFAATLGRPDLLARAHLIRGDADRVRTDPPAALVHLERAEALAREHGTPEVLLETFEVAAVMQLQRGDVEGAAHSSRQALALCADHGVPRTEAFAHIALASALLMQDELAEASAHTQAARDLFERLHNWEMLAQVLNLEGELLRARRDLPGARAAYEEAIALLRLQSGDEGHVRYVELNVALTLIEQGKYREAEPIVWNLLGRFADDDGPSGIGRAWCGASLLPCLAATGRWPDFDAALVQLEAALTRHHLAERDLARCTARAGGLARQAGHPERARRCWLLASEQYGRLGAPEDQERIQLALNALPTQPV